MLKLKNIKYKIGITLIILIFFSFLINIVGCEKKEKGTPPELVKQESIVQKDTIPKIIGVWKGKFDKRDFTLTIIKQDSTSFEGETVIKYREQINQKVTGYIDTTNLEITMKDILHSRYAGTYKGNISKEWETITGKFTVKVDGKKFDFNLKRVK